MVGRIVTMVVTLWLLTGAASAGTVTGGVLDLRNGLPADGTILTLDGDWLVRWGWLAGAESGQGRPGPDWTPTPVPKVWNEQRRPDGRPMGSSGAATYRLLIRLPPGAPALTLELPSLNSASRVWLNGRALIETGRPALTAEDEVSRTVTRFLTLPAGMEEADIAIEISNHFHHEGGMVKSLRLAAGDGLQRAWDLRQLINAGVTCSLVMLALYLAGLARRDMATAYALLTASLFSTGLRLLCTSELLRELAPGIGNALYYRLEYLPICLFWPIYFHMLDNLYPGYLHRRVGWAMDFAGFAGGAYVLFADPMLFTRTRDLMSLLLGLSVLYFIGRIIAAARDRRFGAILLGIGTTVFLGSVLHDALMYAHVFNSVDMAPTGALVFMMFHAMVLGRRLLRAFDDVQLLSHELVQLNEGLEQQVQDRTRALRDQSAVVERVLRNAKERAEADALRKSRFLAHLSHEVRTPMNAVLGMIRLVLRDGAEPRQAERLTVAESAGRRLVTLLDDVLDLSRLEAGKITLSPAAADVAALAREAVALFQPLAAEKGLAIRLTIDGAVGPWYRADRLRFQQILLNLLSNAVKFTEAGEIHVLVQHRNQPAPALMITVSDSGPGIPDTAKATIFDAFTRLESRGESDGSGLGLAIVHGLAEAMGGTVTVADRPGGGAVFTVTLPAEAVPAPAAAVPRQPLPPPVPMDILMVEDAPENRAVLREFLAPGRHRMVMAGSGEEALRRVAERRFDIILMDIRLPGISGVETTRRIRALADEDIALTPIIAITANISPDDIATYRQAGIDEVLAKPLAPEHLADALARHAPAVMPADASPPDGHDDMGDEGDTDRITPLLGVFAAACADQRHALGDALTAGDRERIGAIAHRLKGSAGTFGFPALAAAATDLDRAVRGGQPVEALAARLDEEVGVVLNGLRAMTPPAP